MNTDATRQIEQAARMIAATIRRDVVVYQMPSGALESRSVGAPPPSGGEPICTASCGIAS